MYVMILTTYFNNISDNSQELALADGFSIIAN